MEKSTLNSFPGGYLMKSTFHISCISGNQTQNRWLFSRLHLAQVPPTGSPNHSCSVKLKRDLACDSPSTLLSVA